MNGVAREDARYCTNQYNSIDGAHGDVVTYPSTAPTATTAAIAMTITTITACLMMASLEPSDEPPAVVDDDAVGVAVGVVGSRVGALVGTAALGRIVVGWRWARECRSGRTSAPL
jgi:hypothetical protein